MELAILGAIAVTLAANVALMTMLVMDNHWR